MKNPFVEFDPKECEILANAIEDGQQKAKLSGVVRESSGSYFRHGLRFPGYYSCAIGFAGLSLNKTPKRTEKYFQDYREKNSKFPIAAVAKDLKINEELCETVDNFHEAEKKSCNASAIIKLLRAVGQSTKTPR